MALRLAILVLLTAYGCNAASTTQSPAPTPSEDPTAEPLPLFPERELPADASQWDRLIARVGTQGAPDKQAALDAFAIAFTPLPGTSEPEGERAPVEDGTLAVTWIRHFWEQLTPEQQAFADPLIKGEAPQALFQHRPVAAIAPMPLSGRAPLMATNDWQALADEMQATIADRWDRELGAQVIVQTVDTVMDVPEGLWHSSAWADGRDAQGEWSGQLATCTIVIPPDTQEFGPVQARMLMAHEMFHCFDFSIGTLEAAYQTPPWVAEGAAQWAEMDIESGGTDEIAFAYWAPWLGASDFPLYMRAYTAFGIFYLLQNTGTEPWGVMDQILQASRAGGVAAYDKLVEIGGDFFLDTWGSRYFLYGAPSDGNFRYAGGRLNIEAFQFLRPAAVPITPGEQASAEAFPYAANVFLAGINSDVVTLRTPGGHGWVKSEAGESTLEGTADQPFCTRPEGCACPNGAASPLDFVAVPFGSHLSVGMTGHLYGEEITVVGYDLEDFCEQQPDEDECDEVCPGSNGDPHLITVDGRDYDFQAAGEFTLLRSADGGFQIQARQEPWRDSRSVSINTAIAVGLNEDRAVVYAEPNGTRLSVNGVDVPFSEASAAGDLQLEAVPNGIKLEAPDGTAVWVIGEGTWGLNIAVAPSDGLIESGTGLLGPVGGEFQLPALPDGSQVPVADHIRSAIYEVLGPAWEVAAEDSLFDYAAGEGPHTFRDPSLPEPGAPLDFDSLGLDQQAAGMQTCAAVDDLTLREHCAFDVAVTGDAGFVGTYEQTEAVLGAPLGEPQPTDAGTPGPRPGGDVCGVLSDAQIMELTGLQALSAEPGVTIPQIFTAGCHWSLDAQGSDIPWDVILNVQSPGGRQAFDSYLLSFPNLEHVPGIADDAVLHAANSVVAIKGDTRFDVQYINFDDPNAEAVLIELAKAIATGL